MRAPRVGWPKNLVRDTIFSDTTGVGFSGSVGHVACSGTLVLETINAGYVRRTPRFICAGVQSRPREATHAARSGDDRSRNCTRFPKAADEPATTLGASLHYDCTQVFFRFVWG
ncbi:hypothetical protein ACJJTC_004541 [Scirpophaga incertulas]